MADPHLQVQFNHLFLPPKLPDHEDVDVDEVAAQLHERLLLAARDIRDRGPDDCLQALNGVCRALKASKTLHEAGLVNRSALADALHTLDDGDFVFLHIAAQNAAVVVRKHKSNFTFDAFEASAKSSEVLGAAGALQWEFPGSSVTVSEEIVLDKTFFDCLMRFMEQASGEKLPQFAAKATKAHTNTPEERDTADPALVTDALMTILEVNGASTPAYRIQKRIRDDACFASKGSPWRRSPYWVVLRVSIQQALHRMLGNHNGRVVYKFIMCRLLQTAVNDLDRSSIFLTLETIAFASAKLARRLTKLTRERSNATGALAATLDHFFQSVGPHCLTTLRSIKSKRSVAWDDIRRQSLKIIASPPSRASPNDLRFSLPNSFDRLSSILSMQWNPAAYNLDVERVVNESECGTLMNRYMDLLALGDHSKQSFVNAERTTSRTLSFYHQAMSQYLLAAAEWRHSGVESYSLIVLTILELWTAFDKAALEEYPLLHAYPIPFSEHMLQVLQLSCRDDMQRLLTVEEHLRSRRQNADVKLPTIFDDPTTDSFSVRYFGTSPNLPGLLEKLIAQSERDAEAKQRELQRETLVYNGLAEAYNRIDCTQRADGHDQYKCRRCYIGRQKAKKKIKIYEHTLPSDECQRKAICFELAAPSSFFEYRDMTWRLVCELGDRKLEADAKPPVRLFDFEPLSKHSRLPDRSLSLVSETKSWSATHYNFLKFPASPDNICKPCGLTMRLFDVQRQVYTQPNSVAPSLAASCTEALPNSSPLQFLQLRKDYAVDGPGPTPNAVVATRAICPPRVGLDEFLAYGDLHIGYDLQWMRLYRELGSSNINFSALQTRILVARIVQQVGPSKNGNLLRKKHWILRDAQFCSKLIAAVGEKVQAVASNWREWQCIDAMLLILLQLSDLADDGTVLRSAQEQIYHIRSIALQWARSIRIELHHTQDNELFEARRRDVVWACLLVRKTFQPEAALVNSERGTEVRSAEVYVECSIILQQHLEESFHSIPGEVQRALIRDRRSFYRLRAHLEQALQAHPECLSRAITNVLASPDNPILEELRSWEYFPGGWFTNQTSATRWANSQRIDYNLDHGYFLLGGKPLGKLPTEHRNAPIIKALFGDQPLLIYPSDVNGMQYRLAVQFGRQQVHLGISGNRIIIRAIYYGQILELVDRRIFLGNIRPDLPGPLLQDCVHWLNLGTGVLEIRPASECWESKESNWFLNMHTRTVERHHMPHFLVDPHNQLFGAILTTFGDFENESHMIAYQAQKFLCLEMKRHDLVFKVRNGQWFSEELRAEVDPDQDARTWYGLDSKLVLRDHKNFRARSIIVPFGEPMLERLGGHVSIKILPVGRFGRYGIDNTLHRLSCAAEPDLVYLKILCHALTSYIEPDPLTSRTGTEEALACLQAANARPWVPLNDAQRWTLCRIADISPTHAYYPPGGKELHRTNWSEKLSVYSQNEGLRLLVDVILQRSDTLGNCFPPPSKSPQVPQRTETHLAMKNLARSLMGLHDERLVSIETIDIDKAYQPRDRPSTKNKRRLCVAEIVHNLKEWPSQLPLPPRLSACLGEWKDFPGFTGNFTGDTLVEVTTLGIGQAWASIVNYCRASDEADRFRLMFVLGVMSFATNVSRDFMRSLMAFVLLDEVKDEEPPIHDSYTGFKMNEAPTKSWLTKQMSSARMAFHESDSNVTAASLTRERKRQLNADRREHDLRVDTALSVLAEDLLQQWPHASLCSPSTIDPDLVSVANAIDLVQEDWQRLAQNHELSNYLARIDELAGPYRVSKNNDLVLPTIEYVNTRLTRSHTRLSPPFERLSEEYPFDDSLTVDLQTSDASFCIETGRLPIVDESLPDPEFKTSEELAKIIKRFSSSNNQTRQEYGIDLERSLQAYTSFHNISRAANKVVNIARLSSEIDRLSSKVLQQQEAMRKSIEADPARLWLDLGGLASRCTTTDIVQSMANRHAVFAPGMRNEVVRLTLSVTALQRLMRVEHAVRNAQHHTISSELRNTGHVNWDPASCPEWLLLEVECNLLIRPQQVEVARATIQPTSPGNAVLQMNMGEGKTSCIIPMAVILLANTQSLVRVMVPKALLPQVAQVLQTRIGGLLGRQIIHVPFSRRTTTDTQTLQVFNELHQHIMARKGVVLTIPEHILSFKLSGLQRLLDGRHKEAATMVDTQNWLGRHARDILDESDYTLAVRTQLIYPSGAQRPVDGHPHRWMTVQSLLDMTSRVVYQVHRMHPNAVDIECRSTDRFPTIHFLQKDAEDALVDLLVANLCNGHYGLVPIFGLSNSTQENIRSFLCYSTIHEEQVVRLEKTFSNRSAEWKTLLLLRGLLAHRILILALKKKWNVQYGLHPQRHPIAVPFYAKGRPSETAEWGHPDVAILLTSLSFYYSGISKEQLQQSLGSVMRSEDRESVYDRWVQSTRNVKRSLANCHAINVDDDIQLGELWHAFRHSIIVIDYYLNNFVFPLHAKQFEHKLQASGWDVPLASAIEAKIELDASEEQPVENMDLHHRILTTGFSGTNDNRSMLPLTVTQNNPAQLRRTNAEVLAYLLEPRNQKYLVAADIRGKKLSEDDFLRCVHQEGIRLVIDAGAQVLEYDNLSFVKAWMHIDHHRPAAVYFNDNDKAMVYHRQGHETPLLASPYADDLTECLVYLDEAHTRGTDLKFPVAARGMLTIGLGQSKDHMVQAAMRLRQLGTTQSILFCAPPEVDQSIRDYCGKQSNLTSSDVVAWFLEQTCKGLEQLQPLFVSQGVDYCRRMQAVADNPRFIVSNEQSNRLLRALKHKEDHSLRDLYQPKKENKAVQSNISIKAPELSTYMDQLMHIRKGFEGTDIEASQVLALQEVEQEREISHEVETVREIQGPPPRKALGHRQLAESITTFCARGRLLGSSEEYEPAFDCLHKTHVGGQFGILPQSKNGSRLYVTRDFSRTVKVPLDEGSDDAYLRSVDWVLYSRVDDTALIISPHEAEQLLPRLVRFSTNNLVHLIVYSAPITRKMLHFDDLNHFAVPALPSGWKAPQALRRDLRIFSGGLFFRMADYEDLCAFLGMQSSFTDAAEPTDLALTGSLTEKPLRFLQQWLNVRRHGQDFSQTPMGYLVAGKELTPDLAFFAED